MRRSLLLLSSAVLIVTPAFAASSAPTSIAAAENHHVIEFTMGNDLYRVGETVHVDQAVAGDVFAASESVRIAKSVGGDLSAAGGTITIEAPVRDDVRAVGGDITVNAPVGGDLLIFGGRVTIGEKASVTGDLTVYGGTVRIEGRVRGSVRIEASEASLLGSIGGSADVRAERLTLSGTIGRDALLAARSWYVGDDAHIGGKLRYWQPEGTRSFEGILAGKPTYDSSLAFEDHDKKMEGIGAALIGAMTAYSVLSGAFVIAVLMLLTRTFFRDAGKRMEASPLRSFFVGLLYFLLTPAAVLLLCATIIGIPLALLLAALYIFSFVFAKAMTAIVLERWFEHHFRKSFHGVVSYLLALCVLVLLKVLILIPFLWIVMVVIVAIAFGAIAQTKYQKYLKIR